MNGLGTGYLQKNVTKIRYLILSLVLRLSAQIPNAVFLSDEFETVIDKMVEYIAYFCCEVFYSRRGPGSREFAVSWWIAFKRCFGKPLFQHFREMTVDIEQGQEMAEGKANP
jgi:hypothetical protein